MVDQEPILLPEQFVKNRDALVQAAAEGATIRMAASSCGLWPNLVNKWLQRGQQDVLLELETPYSQFFLDFNQASYQASLPALQTVRSEAATNWKAATWWLERRHPEDFGGQKGGNLLDILEKAEGSAIRIIEVSRDTSTQVTADDEFNDPGDE